LRKPGGAAGEKHRKEETVLCCEETRWK
jgi:hypothetical protein